MAKFTPGPAVAAVSGSIGGTVFSRNRGGAYMRFRAVPVTSTTSFALAAKARFTSATQAWQGLTAGQRLAWEQKADASPVINTLGFPVVLTGHQFFVGLHSRMAAAGDTPVLTPPIVAAPDALASLVLDADIGAGDTDVTFTATPLGATEELWIQAAVTNSAGIEYVRNLLRLCGQSAAAQTSPFDIQSLVETRLGTLVVGQTLHVEVSVYDNANGQLSQPLRDEKVVSTS